MIQNIVRFIVAVAISMISTYIIAYVTHDVYAMFIQPTTHFVVPTAFFIGIALLVTLYTYSPKDDDQSVSDTTLNAWVLCLSVWIVANSLFKILPYFS